MMSTFKGYYSLIQYCPDLGRLEAANVGVLLFCPELRFLKAKTTKNNARIIQFFGRDGHDWEQIKLFKTGIEDRLMSEAADIRTLEDLQRFIALRANLIQITPPRSMKVTDPEKDLQALAQEFDLAISKPKPERSFKGMVRDRLVQAWLEKKLKTDIRLTVPLFNRAVEIPMGYKNGAFNLLTPVQFGSPELDQSIARACKYAVEGNSLNETVDPELGRLQFCVIGQFRPNDVETRAVVAKVLGEHKVKLYRMDQLPMLIDEIRRHGKDLN
jgi:hypothetical protein